jgi:hypothetical protein
VATRLTEIPDRINAGTSAELTLGWSDYPADGGWSLSLYFNGPAANSVVINGADVVANGKVFDVTISATKTGTMGTAAPPDGIGLHWVARLTSGSLVKDVQEGDIIVDPDPVTAGAYQSQAEKELAQCNTVILARLNGSALDSWAIGSREGKYMPLQDLTALRASLEARVASEKTPGRILIARAVFTGIGAER